MDVEPTDDERGPPGRPPLLSVSESYRLECLLLGVEVPPVYLDPDDRMLALARSVGPRLVQDGIFLAGLDIAGDKVLETNTLSPGGLNTASRLHGVDFAGEVIRAVERKVELGGGGGAIGNRGLAAL